MSLCRSKNRRLNSLTALGYLLVVALAPFFHNHDGGLLDSCAGHDDSAAISHDADASRGHAPAQESPCHSDNSHCAVCQYLSQKTVATPEIDLTDFGVFVQSLCVSSPAFSLPAVFTAWQSRAPPVVA
jgi:hypothetical protein